MRKSKKIAWAGIIGIWMSMGSAWAAERKAEKKVEVSVNGMVCSFCAQGITKKFNSEEAVSNIEVSLEEHRVALALKEGRDLSNEEITEILKDAGYTVEKIERK